MRLVCTDCRNQQEKYKEKHIDNKVERENRVDSAPIYFCEL